jgi:hypothetical protein
MNKAPVIPQKFLRPRAYGESRGMPYRTVYDHIQKGYLPAYKFHGRLFLDVEQCDMLIKGMERVEPEPRGAALARIAAKEDARLQAAVGSSLKKRGRPPGRKGSQASLAATTPAPPEVPTLPVAPAVPVTNPAPNGRLAQLREVLRVALQLDNEAAVALARYALAHEYPQETAASEVKSF